VGLYSFKSPGPDGINLRFFKDFWDMFKVELLNFFAEFHRNGRLTSDFNNTFIALIAKIENPHRLADFWPISLVSSLYKILSRVLANRLRKLVSKVVSESKSIIVQGRQILDGILITNELVDDVGRLKKELLMFKVNFERAYASVDWRYLEEAMGKMNFPFAWRKWMMACAISASTSVLINGSPTDEFIFERGLRKGDPLSPFLFLLAVEGLNVIMNTMVDNGLFCIKDNKDTKYMTHIRHHTCISIVP